MTNRITDSTRAALQVLIAIATFRAVFRLFVGVTIAAGGLLIGGALIALCYFLADAK